jgi:two-component system sensor histidine kinase BaeS
MRSLAWKLTWAFLVVGVVGVLVFAFLIVRRTRTEFDRFLSSRDQATLVDALERFYATTGSWRGVREALLANRDLAFYARSATLVDADGAVLLGPGPDGPGQTVPPHELAGGTPIRVDGARVATVLFAPVPARRGDPAPFAPLEALFLSRVMWAILPSALITMLVALAVGGLLARTLTRPVRELTAATQAMARGDLHQQVQIHTQDEIGELGRSFNRMSADLAHASHLRTQMTADLAHDLRTPLSILRGYMEGLKEGRISGTPALYTLMHEEVEHLQRLIDDLRVLSLADAGELPLHRRTVDPAALLERTALAYMLPAEQQGLALRVESAASLPSIWVDTDRMTQVLNNLVSNALRHTVQGEIVLSGAPQDGQVVLRVRDTGSGIAPEDVAFVFDRFYRGDKARQRTDAGASGLGLAIAKAIVEAHGGAIAIESTAGQGTTFTIALPAA